MAVKAASRVRAEARRGAWLTTPTGAPHLSPALSSPAGRRGREYGCRLYSLAATREAREGAFAIDWRVPPPPEGGGLAASAPP